MSVTDFGLCTGHIMSFRSSRIRLLFFLSPLYCLGTEKVDSKKHKK